MMLHTVLCMETKIHCRICLINLVDVCTAFSSAIPDKIDDQSMNIHIDYAN